MANDQTAGRTESTPVRWWDDEWNGEPLIDHWISGVFEGGGAKGIAYAGALEALALRRCWFKAVAGASAGAITASLVAAGLTPAQVRCQTPLGLSSLAGATSRVFRGARRLRQRSGFLSKDKLHHWLHQILQSQARRFLDHDLTEAVTFESLFEATGIELDVVAADLSSHSQIVFNYILTPSCQVVDAVLASASIPFVFESAELVIPEASQPQSGTDGNPLHFYSGSRCPRPRRRSDYLALSSLLRLEEASRTTHPAGGRSHTRRLRRRRMARSFAAATFMSST